MVNDCLGYLETVLGFVMLGCHKLGLIPAWALKVNQTRSNTGHREVGLLLIRISHVSLTI